MILVTHQIQFIKAVENIIIMDKGKVVAQGGFEELNVGKTTFLYFILNMKGILKLSRFTGARIEFNTNYEGKSQGSARRRFKDAFAN